MGKAARKQRRALEVPKGQQSSPGWKVYARIWQVLAKIEGQALKNGGDIDDKANLLQLMRFAHIVYVDPIQAAAAPRPDEFSMDRLPFPVILLATGEESGDRNSPPFGALMVDYRYAAEGHPSGDDVIVMPIYGARFMLSFQGLAVLHDGQLFGTGFRQMLNDAKLTGGKVTEESLRPEPDTERGAAIALSALDLLKSANVDLQERQSAPKPHRAAGVPTSEIVIRQRHARYTSTASSPVEWSHRWEVRGHYKHFTKGPIFDANPDRRIEVDGAECVRLWCPPFVKGPEDKPLVPKVRRTDRRITMPAL